MQALDNIALPLIAAAVLAMAIAGGVKTPAAPEADPVVVQLAPVTVVAKRLPVDQQVAQQARQAALDRAI